MKLSRRAKRMERSHRRHKIQALNLVSLMDIFTILVFFLLVSSSNSYQLPNTSDLKLPSSSADTAPEQTLVIALTKNSILVEGRKIVSIAQALESDQMSIAELKQELELLSQKSEQGEQGRKITIMSDEDAPYAVLRMVLASCQEARFTRIAFAAMQRDLSPSN